MHYTLVTTPSARKSLKKLPRNIREALITKLTPLRTDSDKGKPLQGKFKALRALTAVLISVNYRVVYKVDKVSKEVIIIYAATRENFYKELRRLKLKAA